MASNIFFISSHSFLCHFPSDARCAPGATGNVFWAASSDENVVEAAQQKWIMTLVEEGSGLPEVGGVVTDFPTSAYYSNNNATYALGSGYVGECTWYCNGRAYEKKGDGNICTYSAGKWYDNVSKYSKRDATTVPAADSIGCFGAGHVVYIEKVAIESGTTYIYFSECNWYSDDRLSNGEVAPPPYGTDGALKKSKWMDFKARSGGTYQGCILL